MSLNISHNKILDAQPQPSQQQIEEGSWDLSERNAETMLCFKDFIKYNAELQMINLENTGLIEPAIRFIVPLLRRA